jgi:hypothetical protein
MMSTYAKPKRVRITDTLGIEPMRVVEARRISELANSTVLITSRGERITLPAWDFRTRGPRYELREADGDAPTAQQSQQPKQHDPNASLDARVNSYIDDLLDGDFDATRFAEQLQALAKRAGNVLALEKTVLQMGLQRVPDDKRDDVKRALGGQRGSSNDLAANSCTVSDQLKRSAHDGVKSYASASARRARSP